MSDANTDLKAQTELLRREVDSHVQSGAKTTARLERQIQETKRPEVFR